MPGSQAGMPTNSQSLLRKPFSAMKWDPSQLCPVSLMLSEQIDVGTNVAGMALSQQPTDGRIQLWLPRMLPAAHHPTHVQPDTKSIPGAGFCPESLHLFCSTEQDWTREEKAAGLRCSELFRRASHLPQDGCRAEKSFQKPPGSFLHSPFPGLAHS